MGQFILKTIQTITFITVVFLCMYAGQNDPNFHYNGYGATAFGLFAAYAITIVPYALFLASKGLLNEIKRFFSWLVREPEGLQTTRIDPVFTEPLNNRISRGRIGRDSRPSIG